MLKKHADLRKSFIELAETDQNARDTLLIDEQNFDATQFLLASTLMTSLRAFQAVETRGVPFSDLTPEFIVDFAKRGEAVSPVCCPAWDRPFRASPTFAQFPSS